MWQERRMMTMVEGPDHERAGRLTRFLRPELNGSGVEYSICEQVLSDALAAVPPPRTLRELFATLERETQHRDSTTLELLAILHAVAYGDGDRALEAVCG